MTSLRIVLVCDNSGVAVMPPKKRNTPFQPQHAPGFSLHIGERASSDSDALVAAGCRFCELFGKEEAAMGIPFRERHSQASVKCGRRVSNQLTHVFKYLSSTY